MKKRAARAELKIKKECCRDFLRQHSFLAFKKSGLKSFYNYSMYFAYVSLSKMNSAHGLRSLGMRSTARIQKSSYSTRAVVVSCRRPEYSTRNATSTNPRITPTL